MRQTPKTDVRRDPRPGASEARYKPDRLDARPVKPSKARYNIGLILLGILFIGATAASGAEWRALLDIPRSMVSYFGLMAQGVFQVPDAEVLGYWSAGLGAMLESVGIAWVGTMVGALFSLPMGFLAARNMTPVGLYAVVRFILSVIRAVPEIIFAIAVMLPIFGVGPHGGAMAGAMALGVSSIGTLSKLISEAIEAVDHGPLESAKASGATNVQMIRWTVLPQVMPEVIAIWLYRFEVNIRASAILGVLGAGGIGSLLNLLFSVPARPWDRIGITLVVIVVVTIAVDQISAWIRHRVIYGAAKPAKAASGDGPAPKKTRAEAAV